MAYRLPPLNALRAFEAAARRLSFKHAAEELSVTPTAVSHQIKTLEEFLDLELFRRLTRALELTAHGEALLPQIRAGLESFASALENTRKQSMRERLIVIAPPLFAGRWLVPRLQRFTQINEQVHLHVKSSLNAIDGEPVNGTQIFDNFDLRDHESQVVIRYGTGSYPGNRVDRIFGSDYIAVCSPNLLKAKCPLRKASDVKFHSLLHDDTISNVQARPCWEEWLRVAGVMGVDHSAGPHFSDSGLVLMAAIDGIGIALASKPLVANDIAEGRLIAPFDISVGQHYSYYLVTPEAISDRPVVKSFRQQLLAICTEDCVAADSNYKKVLPS